MKRATMPAPRRPDQAILAAALTALAALTTGCQQHQAKPALPPAAPTHVEIQDSPHTQNLDDLTAQRLIEQRRAALAAGEQTLQPDIPAQTPIPAPPAEMSAYSRTQTAPTTRNAAHQGTPSNALPSPIEPEPFPEPTTFPRFDPQARAAEPNLPAPPACLARLAQAQFAHEAITVNFDQADIRFVIKTVSEITGINFIVDDTIAGNVTVLSPTQIRVADLYTFLESILEIKGYAAVPTDEHVKIVPREQANNHNLQIRIGADPDLVPRTDAVVTQIIPLTYADAQELAALLAGRLAAGARLAAYPRTNTLLLTDTSANIHHALTIIRQLDVPGAQEEWTVIPLRYASASVLAKQIFEIMREEPTRPTPGRPRELDSRLQIEPDPRTNSLIVIAPAQETRVIRQLVAQLDVERPAGVENVYVVYLRNAQAEEIATALTTSLAQANNPNNEPAAPIQVTPDPGTNSLIINASPPDYKAIADIIAKLDIVREQVLVEMLIVEISESDLLEIGVDWATLDNAVSDSVRVFGSTNFGIRASVSNGTFQGLAVGTFKSIAGQTRIGTILGALERVANVDILSTPHLLTSNHREAHILVGNNIPYVTQSRITETDFDSPTVIQTIDYKDVGVEMKITPHISQGAMVRLLIDSSFTQVIDSITGLGPETPTTATRQLKTEIVMPEGETVVIGGLIRDDIITTENKIPLLGDIPLLGNLFKYQRNRTEKTNLLLFITPYVLTDADQLAQATSDKQNQTAHPDQDTRDRFHPRNPVSPRDSEPATN